MNRNQFASFLRDDARRGACTRRRAMFLNADVPFHFQARTEMACLGASRCL